MIGNLTAENCCRRQGAWPSKQAWIASVLLLAVAFPAFAQRRENPEDEFYRLLRFPMLEQIVLEAGALEFLPDGKLAVATRRCNIYFVDKPLAEKPEEASLSLFASGLHEVLGLAYRDGWLYCVQRCEVSRLKDSDGDGRADLFETVSDAWEISG